MAVFITAWFLLGGSFVQADQPLDLSRYSRARSLVHQHYVDPAKLKDEGVLMLSTLKGMVWAVDPMGDCWNAKDYKTQEDLKKRGAHEVGIRWRIQQYQALVLNVIPNSSADKAGVKTGDALWKINSKELGQGTSLGELEQACLRGESGPVVLEFFHARKEISQPLTLKAERLSSSKMEMEAGQFKYLSLAHSKIKTPEDARQVINMLMTSGHPSGGLLIDARRTSDLSVEAAQALAGQLLPMEKTTLGFRVAAKETAVSLTLVRSGSPVTDAPVVLLVDGTTSGMAEVLASCLGSLKRAVIVGNTTAGYTPSQEDFVMEGDLVCRLTTGFYSGVEQKPLHGKGLEPMIKVDENETVKETEGMKPFEKDPYIRRAVSLLKALEKVR